MPFLPWGAEQVLGAPGRIPDYAPVNWVRKDDPAGRPYVTTAPWLADDTAAA